MLSFYSMSLNAYFLSRIPLVCYLTNLALGMSKRQLMDTCAELLHYISKVDQNSMCHYCGAVFRKAVCAVLHQRALVHCSWHKAGIRGEKDAAPSPFCFSSKRSQLVFHGGSGIWLSWKSSPMGV